MTGIIRYQQMSVTDSLRDEKRVRDKSSLPVAMARRVRLVERERRLVRAEEEEELGHSSRVSNHLDRDTVCMN